MLVNILESYIKNSITSYVRHLLHRYFWAEEGRGLETMVL